MGRWRRGGRGRTYLEPDDHGVCLAYEADDDGALLYGLTGIFDLEDSSLRRAAT